LYEHKISGSDFYTEDPATVSLYWDDGELILSGFENGTIKVFQTQTKIALWKLEAHGT